MHSGREVRLARHRLISVSILPPSDWTYPSAWRQLALTRDARFLPGSTRAIYGDPLVHPQAEAYNGNVDPNGPRAAYDQAKQLGQTLELIETSTMSRVRPPNSYTNLCREVIRYVGAPTSPERGRFSIGNRRVPLR